MQFHRTKRAGVRFGGKCPIDALQERLLRDPCDCVLVFQRRRARARPLRVGPGECEAVRDISIVLLLRDEAAATRGGDDGIVLNDWR